MISLPDLHDATLNNMDFEWDAAIAHLTLKVGVAASDVAVIEAVGVTNIRCSRLLPWRPSSSVNSTTLEARAGGRCLTIEMQSGDVLEICCREVAVKRASE